MLDLEKTEILKNNKLFVCIDSVNQIHTNEAITIINTLLHKYKNNIKISVETNNYYEYHGIKKVYDLACLNKDKLFIYFHSKGMVYHNNEGRNPDEIKLTHYTFKNWRDTLNIFKNNNNIQKIGLFPSMNGFVWYNFWWARGEYLSKLNKPIISNDRYYYETWLTPICNDSYSLIANKNICYTKDTYDNYDVLLNMKKL